MAKINLFDLSQKDLETSGKQKTELKFPDKKKKSFIECYTDGGCYNNGRHKGIGAWAFFINSDVAHLVDEELSPLLTRASGGREGTTNNEMEMMALHNLMDMLIRSGLEKEDIKVYIDSSYVVRCFNDGWYATWQMNGWRNSNGDPVKNAELWRKMLNLYNNFTDIEFIHIRGHRGIYGNEVCDKMCKQEMTKLVAKRGGYIVK